MNFGMLTLFEYYLDDAHCLFKNRLEFFNLLSGKNEIKQSELKVRHGQIEYGEINKKMMTKRASMVFPFQFSKCDPILCSNVFDPGGLVSTFSTTKRRRNNSET